MSIGDRSAFPSSRIKGQTVDGQWVFENSGMTIREYTAIAAMNALLSANWLKDSDDQINFVAGVAIRQTDALLSLLEKTKG